MGMTPDGKDETTISMQISHDKYRQKCSRYVTLSATMDVVTHTPLKCREKHGKVWKGKGLK